MRVKTTGIVRLALSWGALGMVQLNGPFLESSLNTGALVVWLGAMIAVTLACSFEVVAQAEGLALRLGDPYGTLILTMSIMTIEVILISAVMLGPGEHSTIARDSVVAATMLLLTFIAGLAIVVGARSHHLRVNRRGMAIYLATITALLLIAFAAPAAVGIDGVLSTGHALTVIVAITVVYVGFLYRQTGPDRAAFQEVGLVAGRVAAPPHFSHLIARHRTEVAVRTMVLVAGALPIALLSHDMAGLVDQGLTRLSGPAALTGLLVAIIVLAPEGITTVRAALMGDSQRVSNLSHGALVSCVGLTLPVVLIIGMATDQHVVLGVDTTGLWLLAAAVAVTAASFLAARIRVIHGLALLAIFALYLTDLLA